MNAVSFRWYGVYRILTAKLTALANENNEYEEIRVAAMQSLDAIDPNGKLGLDALQSAVAGDKGSPASLAKILVMLGSEKASVAVLPLITKDRPEGVRLAAIRTLDDAAFLSPAIVTTFLDALVNDPSWQVRRLIGHRIAAWPGDPARAILVRDALAKKLDVNDEHDNHVGVLIYISSNLPETDRVQYLKTMITGGSRNRIKALEILRQLASGTNKTLADAAAVELKAIEATKPQK